MSRRALLLAPVAALAQQPGGMPAPPAGGMPAPPAGVMPAQMAGRITAPPDLLLQGTASRRYLGFRVYEAELYLAQRATSAAAATDPALVRVRYLRSVGLDDVRRAWIASLGIWDDGFDGWLRPLREGDEERYGFAAQGARLEAPGRPGLSLPPGPFPTALRGSWLGPMAPTALLRGWFPGQ